MIFTRKGTSKLLYTIKCGRCERELLYTKSDIKYSNNIFYKHGWIVCPKCKHEIDIRTNEADNCNLVKAEKIPFLLKLRGYK